MVSVAKMKSFLLMAAALGTAVYVAPTAVCQMPPPRAYSDWQYERTITLAARAHVVEQCAVLDAVTFAYAAPGLRDLRLLQDGREIPYALDESHDEAFDRAAPFRARGLEGSMGDRALYETSLVIPAFPGQWAAAVGPNATDHPAGWFYGNGELPARVPVERVRLIPGTAAKEMLGLYAWQQTNRKDREEMKTEVTPDRPAANFTIGANLQVPAGINIGVNGTMPLVHAFVLEMRRRELCFQPLSSSPLELLLGNESARPVHYDYAAHFHPSATPVLATLGPIVPNVLYRPAAPQRSTRFAIKRVKHFGYACGLVLALWIGMFRRRRH